MIELAVLAVLVLAGLYALLARNRFVRQEHLVEEAWAQVEVELQRRQELVPALVEAVQTFTAHDARGLQLALEQARAATGPGSVPAAERQLTLLLHRLPPGPYERLQDRIAETEDRIAAARRFYNGNVRALEVRLDSFPSSLVGRWAGIERPEPLGELELEGPPGG